MKSNARRHLLLLLFCLAGISACTTTKPLGEWRDPGFDNKIGKVLVIGITSRDERRWAFENGFVEALAEIGVEATPSYKSISSVLKLSREMVVDAVEEQSLGGVLVTRLVGVRDRKVYKIDDGDEEARNFFSYYDNAWEQSESGHTESYRTLTLETNLYDAGTRKLVWSMQSEVIDATQPRDVIKDQISLATRKLSRQGLLIRN